MISTELHLLLERRLVVVRVEHVWTDVSPVGYHRTRDVRAQVVRDRSTAECVGTHSVVALVDPVVAVAVNVTRAVVAEELG